MRHLAFAIIIVALLFTAMTAGAQAVRVFTSEQVGTNPVTGYCLTTDGAVSTWAPCGTGGGGTPGGSNGQLQFNNAGTFAGTSSPSVTTINATSTTASSSLPNIIAQRIQALTSAGLQFFSNSGTLVADFGAGGGSNVTFSGGVNIDGTTRLATSLNGLLAANSGVVTAQATGTLSCTGPLSCTARSVIGGDTAISLSTAGDWTGTLDGQDGSFYLANSFSSTSANTYLSSIDKGFFWSTSSANTWEGTQTARTADDLTNNSIEDLNDVAAMTENTGDLLSWNGSTWTDAATSTLGLESPLTFSFPLTRTGNAVAFTGLGTSSPWTAGQVAYVVNGNTIASAATGTVSGTNGITVTAGRAALGGALAIDCTVASGSAAGCLSTANFAVFNNKVSSTTIDTLAELEALQGAINIIQSTEIDTSGELDTLVTDNTGSGALVFGTSPTFTSPTLTSYYSAACASGEAVQDISDTGTFTCIAVGGGGGGGALSTTTDLIGVGPTSTVSYVTGDVMFGGSSSTTAEFQLDDDGAQFIISSSSAFATSTFANTNSAQALQFGTASVTNPSIVAGFDIDFKTAGQAIMRALGTVTDFVFSIPVQIASTLKDGTGSAGSNGNVLTSTGTGVEWVATSSLGISGGSSSSFTAGPTSTPIWRSTLQGWTFPDGANVNTDIAANRFHTIKPIWYEVDNAGGDIGTLDQRTVASYGAFGYNASNTELIKQYSTEQFVTVSGNHPEIHTLTASSTLVTTEIAELIAFATSTGFTGIELDWEGFADWTAQNTTDYINFVTRLSNEAHKYGLKTMIYLPPIWNSAANAESGSGDEWDTANSDGYYELEYEDFENVPVDYIVIAVYDYQFDYGAGRPNAPLKWQDEIISYAKRKISDHDRLIIGIPAAGYGGATGGFSFTAYTYASSTVLAGFSGATRDTESGELTWTNGGNSYFICDDTCINTKRERVEREGINRVSLWHIGNNKYGSGKAEPTIQEPPATNETDARFFGELSGFIARFFSSAGSLVMSISDTIAIFNIPVQIVSALQDSAGSSGVLGDGLISTGTSTRWVNHRDYTEWFKDFMAETTNAGDETWAESNTGTGAGCTNAAIVVGNRPGMSTCTTGTTATGRAGHMTGLSSLALGQGTTTAEHAIRITTLSDATNRYSFRVGFQDTAAAAQVDAAYILYDEGGVTTGSAASANFQCVTASNSSRTYTTTGTAVAAATWYTFKIEVNPAGTEVNFYINDTNVCTHTTNIPTGTTRALGHGVQMLKSIGTTARTYDVDYHSLKLMFTTPR